MNQFIDIIEVQKTKDSSGFMVDKDVILASVRAYKEFRHGNTMWANRAAFSTATVLFRFRKIPGVEILAKHFIVCDSGRYSVLSIENIKNRDMYTEVLCEEVKING